MTTKLFSLSCEDQPGILSKVLQHFARPGYRIHTLTQSRTDIRDIILLSIQAAIPGAAIDNLLHKLERLIGVLDVTISFGAIPHTAHFHIRTERACPNLYRTLQCHGASIIRYQENGQLLIRYTALPDELQRLYNKLDDPSLLAYSETHVALAQPLERREVNDIGVF